MASKTKLKDEITPDLERIQEQLMRKLPKKGLAYLKNLTPVDSGNAKRKTKLIRGNTIHMDYPYADVIDEGKYGTMGYDPIIAAKRKKKPKVTRKGYSKQAPKGLTGPTTKYINKVVKAIFKGRAI